MPNGNDNTLSTSKSRLTIRKAEINDIPAVVELTNRIYEETGMEGYSYGAIRGQLNNFPDGQFVAMVNEKVVGEII